VSFLTAYIFSYYGGNGFGVQIANCTEGPGELYTDLHAKDIKGNVQRKLRWVKNGVNRSVGASDCGAGHSFVVLFGFHLGFAIFPFPVSTVKIIGDF
jgi:hypothetical protein